MGGRIEKVNIFRNIPAELSREYIETLTEAEHVRIERIVSRGHASAPDFWYDQTEDEYVLLIQGRARLKVYGDSGFVSMNPGDGVIIPKHVKHRVEWTDPDQDTIWLAIFYR
jgi:cupin 2 domain-containing protein